MNRSFKMGRKSNRKKRKAESGLPAEVPRSGTKAGFALFLVEIIRWGAYIALFAPLVVHPAFFFPFVVPKSVFFWIFTEIIFAAWLLLAVSNKQFRPRWNAISIALGSFLLVTVVTSFTGINLERSFWSTLERMAGTINWIHLAMFFLVVASTFRDASHWKKLLSASFIAAAIVSLIFLFQKIGISIIPFDTKDGSTIGNSSFMSAYLLFNIFFGMWLFYKERVLQKQALYGIGIALLILSVFFSTAHGAFLSMFGGFLIFFLAWLFFAKKVKFARAIAISIFAAGILFGSIVSWGTLTQNKAIIDNLPGFFSSASIGARKVVWNMAWQGAKERPILGWGPENFNAVFTKYFNPCLPLDKCGGEVWFDRTHNVILDNLIHSGIIGLMAYLSIFVSALFMLWRKIFREPQNWFLPSALTVALLAYFVQNLLVFDMLNTYIMFFFTLAFAGSAAYFKDVEKESGEKSALRAPSPLISAIVGAILVYSLFYFGVQSFQAAHWGIKISRGGLNARDTIELYKKSISLNSLGNRQIVEFFTINISDLLRKDTEKKVPADFVMEVEKIMRKTAEENPYDFRHQVILGDFYTNAQEYDPGFIARAEDVLKNAIDMSPTNQQGYRLLAQVYMFTNDYEKAIDLLSKSVALEPDLGESHWYLGRAYDLSGNKERAEEAFAKAETLGYQQ